VALVLPLILTVGVGVVSVRGATSLDVTRQEMIAIRDRLGLMTIPEIKILGLLLWVSVACLALVLFGLVLLLVRF
jgi:hypothetical protein